VARPHTLRERLEYLEREARRILASPEAHTPEERAWARDMIGASPAGIADERP